ncbi:MAG: hypothetical protein H5T59_04290, partial [Anaerolineae bacterium]|nr:hypothetical protein [Anaerolineae bacterium]
VEYNDLKPEHLLWNGRQLRVVDWNAARPLGPDGEARDLYKFGELMLHLLTGSPVPRLRPLPDIAFVRSDPRLLTLDYPGDVVPPSLLPLVERTLRGEYPSAAALAEELRLHTQIHLQLSLPPAGILNPIEDLMDRRRYREAIAYLRQVRAVVGEQETVQDLLQEAEEALETLAMAYLTRGEAEARVGMWAKAAESYKLAWRERPDDQAAFLHYVACHLVAQGELGDAARDELLAAAHAFAAGHYEESLRRLKALEGEDAPDLQEVLAYVKQDVVPRLLAQLEDPGQVGPIVRFFPDSSVIQERYAELLADRAEAQIRAALEAHRYQDALRLAQDLRERVPGSTLAQEVLEGLGGLPEAVEEGFQALQQGDVDRAVDCLSQAMRSPWFRGDERVEQGWANARARQMLRQAREARTQGAYAQAASLLETGRQELAPLWERVDADVRRHLEAETCASRAWLEFSLGEYQAARQELERAVAAMPEATTWQEDLRFVRQVEAGARRMAEGAYDEAVGLLQSACHLRPGEPQAERLLEQARQERYRNRVRVLAFQKARAAESQGDVDRALEIYQHLLLEGYAEEGEIREAVSALLNRQAQRVRERLWQEAQALREAGRLRAAVEALRRLLEQAPSFPGAAEELTALETELAARAQQAVVRGKQAYDAGDLAAARKHFLEALEHTPEAPEAQAYLADMDRLQEHLERGRQALAAHRPAEAMDHFQRAQVLCPASPEVQECLHQARRLQELLARNREMARHSLGRAEEAVRAGQYAEAQGYLRDLLGRTGIPPELALQARVLQVHAALGAGRTDEARQHLEALAAWLEQQGWQRERELARLRQALAQEEARQRDSARRAEEHLRQARDALAGGRLEEAQEAAAKALSLRPHDAAAAALLQEAQRQREVQARARHLLASAKAFFSLGELAQAQKAAHRALELAPTDGEAQAFLREVRIRHGLEQAEAALANRRFDEAQAALEEVLRLDPANAKGRHLVERAAKEREAYRQLRQLLGKGSTSLHLRDYRQAVECFAQVLQLDPDNAEAQARYEQALQGLREVVETHRHLAEEAFAHRDFEAADAYLHVAEELAPADPALVTLRANLDRARARAKAIRERADQGNRALLAGDYENAAELLEWAAAELPEDDPERPRLQEGAALAREMLTLRIRAANALESHMYDQAISLLERILGQFPRDEESRALLQKCLNQREEASRMIQQLLKQVRQSEQGGQYDRALDLCITAENVYPWQREVTATRQRIHKLQTLLELMQRALQLGSQEEAWALAREGYALNPYDTRFQQVVREGEYATRVAEARDALERGKAAEAVDILSRLTEDGLRLRGPDQALWQLATAIATAEEALLQGDYAEAEDTLRPVAREHPVARRLWQRIRRARRLSQQGHQALDQA